MSINFASAFQSVQVNNAHVSSRAALASTAINNASPRFAVLTLDGNRIEPFASVYQRPVMPVGNANEVRLLTQGKPVTSLVETTLKTMPIEAPHLVCPSAPFFIVEPEENEACVHLGTQLGIASLPFLVLLCPAASPLTDIVSIESDVLGDLLIL